MNKIHYLIYFFLIIFFADEFGPTTLLNSKWNTSTIVLTAVISSFIAILMVLLLIFIAMVARHKLLISSGRRKQSPAESQEGTLPYDNQTDFGYVSPDEIRKCKITTTGEYTEPFSTTTNGPHGGLGSLPPLITFPGSNLHSIQGSGAGDSGSGGAKMAEYYSCTLISNPVPPNNSGNY